MQPSERDEIRDLLKRTAVALKQGDVPFALCGGYAAFVRGAPEPDHDADFLVPAAEVGDPQAVVTHVGDAVGQVGGGDLDDVRPRGRRGLHRDRGSDLLGDARIAGHGDDMSGGPQRFHDLDLLRRLDACKNQGPRQTLIALRDDVGRP